MATADLIYFCILFLIISSTQSIVKTSEADAKSKSFKLTDETPKISAVLLECPRERSESSKVSCDRQLLVHIRMSPTFQIDSMDKFLLLDEVYDERTHTKAKLMAPYLIEVSRGEPVIMYPLEFAKSIRCDTCGYGNDKSSASNTGELCEENTLLSRNNPQSETATLADNAKLNDPTQFSRQEHYTTRGIKAEVKLEEQQNERANAQKQLQRKEHDLNEDKFIDSEDSGKKSNVGLGKSLGESESNERLTMDVVAVDDGNLVRFQSQSEEEEGYIQPSSETEESDSLFRTDEEYEGDDYDESNADEDMLLGLAEEKELRTRLSSPILAENRNKFLEKVERRREEAQPVGIRNEFSSPYGQGKKIYQDSSQAIERHFKATSSEYSDRDEGPIRRNKQSLSRLPKVYEGAEDEVLLEKRKIHLINKINKRPKVIRNSYPLGRAHRHRDALHRKLSNLNRESASLLTAAVPPFRLHKESGESSDEQPGRQDSYGAVMDAGGEEEISAVDYEDNMRHLTPEIQSRSNIAKVDSTTMGEEFYLNTLNYPRGKRVPGIGADSSRGMARDVLDNSKLGGYGSLSEDRREPQRMGREQQPKRRRTLKVKTKSERNYGQSPSGRVHVSLERRSSDEHHFPVDDSNPTGYQMPSSSSRFQADSSCNVHVPSTGSSKSTRPATDKLTSRSNAPGEAVETLAAPYVPPNGHPGLNSHMKDLQVADNSESKNTISNEGPYDERFFSKEDMYRPQATNKFETKSLNKRSLVVYDDLTMRDTYDEYSDTEDRRLPKTLSSDVMVTSNQECNEKLCNSKSQHGKPCRCSRSDGQCECSEIPPIKQIRSVSEAWYSVFNMSAPLQFLTTRVGMYQKRRGGWSKIVPSVTLTSLSGIYANGNLSILFSSHVDIFQLKRSLSASHHKLVIPRQGRGENAFGTLSTNPREILAVESAKFDFIATHDKKEATDGERQLCQTAIKAKQDYRHHRSHSTSEGVFRVEDLGTFPTQMNPMQKCPTGGERLCLNLVDEEVPAFTIRIKQPFLRNALIFSALYRVRIISVVSDATTRGALQVAVVLANEYFIAHEFAACICDCPMACGAKTTVKKDLPPHSAERLTFLLPLEETKPKKMQCTEDASPWCEEGPFCKDVDECVDDALLAGVCEHAMENNNTGEVEVKSPDQKVISKREFIVEPTARCLCMWDCSCHCVPDLVSHDEYNVCRKLSKNDEHSAGFIEGKGPKSRGWELFLRQMILYTLTLVSIALFLGFLKASLGALGLDRINRMGYNYVQPLHKYEYASRWRRFFINTLFFAVLPFIFCCKCFVPSEEDLLVASTVWQCSLLQRDMSDDSSDDGGAAGGYDGTRNGGGRRLYKRYGYNDGHGVGGDGGKDGFRRREDRRSETHRRVRYGNHINDDDNDDEEETILSQRFESGDGSQIAEAGRHAQWTEYLGDACEYDEDEEERDTNYVLQALTESRESIRRLLDTQCNGDIDPRDPEALQAEEYVRTLVAAKIVYRIFDKPLQNVDVPVGQRYSIRGYFVPSIGSGYQYFTPRPLAQLRRITANTIAILLPPIMLHAEAFSREYSSKMEVLQAGDLSVNPPGDAPCINSSNVADPSRLTAARTLDVSSSQVIRPIEQPVGDATNATMRKPLFPFDNATAARDNLIGDASNESNSMAR